MRGWELSGFTGVVMEYIINHVGAFKKALETIFYFIDVSGSNACLFHIVDWRWRKVLAH